MAPPNNPAIQVRSTPIAGRTAALRLVFQNLSDDVRERQVEASLAALEGIEPKEAGLFEAVRVAADTNSAIGGTAGTLGNVPPQSSGQAIIGAIWLQMMPGRVGSVWPPQTAGLEGRDAAKTAGELLAASEQLAGRYGIRLIQALLTTDVGPSAETLTSAGFQHIADLLYLVSSKQAFPTAPPAEALQFVPCSAELADQFAAIVEQTYHGTLDCPQLDGVRTIDEVLEGYRAVGRFSPEQWLLVRRDERDVGCLLVADHPEQQIWELIYMGIVPDARGEGLGVAVARQAQWLAKQGGAERMVLAVDAANAPGLRMYSAAGFVAWDRRSVFTRILRAAQK